MQIWSSTGVLNPWSSIILTAALGFSLFTAWFLLWIRATWLELGESKINVWSQRQSLSPLHKPLYVSVFYLAVCFISSGICKAGNCFRRKVAEDVKISNKLLQEQFLKQTRKSIIAFRRKSLNCARIIDDGMLKRPTYRKSKAAIFKG